MAIDRNGTASETLSGRVVRLGQVGEMGAAIRAVYQHVIDHDGGSKPEESGLGLRHDEEHQWFACSKPMGGCRSLLERLNRTFSSRSALMLNFW